MNEQDLSLQKLRAALPALTRINELYYTAVNLDAQSKVILAADDATLRPRAKPIAIFVGFVAAVILGSFMEIFRKIGDLYLFMLSFSGVAGVAVYHYVLKFLTATKTKAKQKIEENQKVIQDISAEIERVATENAALINELPRDYRFYDAAYFMERAFANDRCSTMREAMNLYEEYAHRKAMEDYNQQLIEENRRQNEMLASIQADSEAAAWNTGVTAVFSVLNFMK